MQVSWLYILSLLASLVFPALRHTQKPTLAVTNLFVTCNSLFVHVINHLQLDDGIKRLQNAVLRTSTQVDFFRPSPSPCFIHLHALYSTGFCPYVMLSLEDSELHTFMCNSW